MSILFEEEWQEAGLHNMRKSIVGISNLFSIVLAANVPLVWLLYRPVPVEGMIAALAVSTGSALFSLWFARAHNSSFFVRHVAMLAVITNAFAVILSTNGVHYEITSTITIGFATLGLIAGFGCPRIMIFLLIAGWVGAWGFFFVIPEIWLGTGDQWGDAFKIQSALAWWWTIAAVFGILISRQIRTAMLRVVAGKRESEEQAREIKVMEDQQAALRATAEQERLELLQQLAGQVDTEIGGVSDTVANNVTALRESISAVNTAVDNSTDRSRAIKRFSSESSENVHTVAQAATELNSSITEISGQFARSSQIGKDAVNQISAVIGKMNDLGKSAESIGGIVELITDIANQTNLLALNATIEAARAGDAGKGFAVVASEVKGLSGQTARATNMIAEQVGNVQDLVKESGQMAKETNDIIGQIEMILTELSGAVEEQSAATRAISENIEHAANAAEQVSANAGDIDQAVTEIRQQMSTASNNTETLNQEANGMKQTVSGISGKIRNA